MQCYKKQRLQNSDLFWRKVTIFLESNANFPQAKYFGVRMKISTFLVLCNNIWPLKCIRFLTTATFRLDFEKNANVLRTIEIFLELSQPFAINV